MTLASGSRVLVVGAGIAGLATARALARAGCLPEVIEPRPVSPDAGTGVYLPGNAVRTLRALGLDAKVAERAVEIPRQRFRDHRGRRLADVDVSQLWADVTPGLPEYLALTKTCAQNQGMRPFGSFAVSLADRKLRRRQRRARCR